MEPAYQYAATVHRVIDGDTYELDIDVGFRWKGVVTVRLHGYNCPETNTEAGKQATDAVKQLLANKQLIVKTYQGPMSHKDVMSFARWVADVYVGEDNTPFGETLVSLGLAKRM